MFLHHKVGGWTWIWEWANICSHDMENEIYVVNFYPRFITRRVNNQRRANSLIFDLIRKRNSNISFIEDERVFISSAVKTLLSLARIKLSLRTVRADIFLFKVPLGRILASNVSLQFGTFDFDLRLIRLRHLLEMLFLIFNAHDKTRTILGSSPHGSSQVVFPNGRDLCTSSILLVAKSKGLATTALELNSFTNTIVPYSTSPHSVQEYWDQLANFTLVPEDYESMNDYFRLRLERDSRFLIYSPNGDNHPDTLFLQKTLGDHAYVTFFSHSEHETPVLEEWNYSSSSFHSQFDSVRALYRACIDRGMTLVVRRHPNSVGLVDKVDREIVFWREFENLPNLLLLGPSSEVDSYNLARGSYAVFVHSSTMGLESNFMGIPSRAMGPAFWAYSKDSRAWSVETLNSFLDSPTIFPLEVCARWAKREMSTGFPFSLFKEHFGRFASFENLQIGNFSPR